jgi:hypothetical protein
MQRITRRNLVGPQDLNLEPTDYECASQRTYSYLYDDFSPITAHREPYATKTPTRTNL